MIVVIDPEPAVSGIAKGNTEQIGMLFFPDSVFTPFGPPLEQHVERCQEQQSVNSDAESGYRNSDKPQNGLTECGKGGQDDYGCQAALDGNVATYCRSHPLC